LANEDRILIQLPGLSEAAKEEAIRTLQRAAFLEFRMVHPESAELLAKSLIELATKCAGRTQRKKRGQGSHSLPCQAWGGAV